MPADFYEEEDFQGQFKGNVFKRILDLMRPHWPWVLGFLICVIIVSILDAYFTYLGKQIVDKGIVGKNIQELKRILIDYGVLIVVQAAAVFGFVQFLGHTLLRGTLGDLLQDEV